MKAFILAAGRGERLRPLTDSLPKPLVEVGGKPLIFYHLEKLAQAGIKEVMINVGYLKEKIKEILAQGQQWNLNIHYSEEEELLETGGGIKKVLPWFNDQAFLVINSDVYTNYNINHLPKNLTYPKVSPLLGHLVLVKNPHYRTQGDFKLTADGYIELLTSLIPSFCKDFCDKVAATGLQEIIQSDKDVALGAKTPIIKGFAKTREFIRPLTKEDHLEQSLTYTGIAVLSPQLLMLTDEHKFPLLTVFKQAIINQQLSGEFFDGVWFDSGTLARLHEIEKFIISSE